MPVKSRFIATATFCILAISLFAICCAGQKGAAPSAEGKPAEVGKSGLANKPDYIDSSLNLPNIGVLDSPKLPFEIGTTYLCEVTNGGVLVRKEELTFSKVGEEGFRAVSVQSILKPGSDEVVAQFTYAYALDRRLRPKMYIKRQGKPGGQAMMIKTIDFSGGMIGVETKYEPASEGPVQNEIRRPEGEIWSYEFENILCTAVLAACIDTSATEAGLWVLDVDREDVGRFAVEFKGGETVTADDGVTSVMANKYDASLDGLLIGTLVIGPDGRLMVLDQPGGLHGTIKVLPKGAAETEK